MKLLRHIILLVLCSLAGFSPAWAQAQYKTFRVFFIDKNHSPYSLDNPRAFLSQRSLDRREKQHLPLTETDLPVSPAYLDSLTQAGFKILYTSRWLNAATIETDDSLFLDKISRFSFIRSGKRVLRQTGDMDVHTLGDNMLAATDLYGDNDYGPSFGQIAMHNGQVLHNEGNLGEGMQIAQLDAGFFQVDSLKAFEQLRQRHGILAVKDFVYPHQDIFRANIHGMYVLSVMAGYLPGKLIGTAPEANYYLIRTENADSENPIEEDSWVAGIEYADSAGADIINSSLVYSNFDDPSLSHTYSDMNGQTTFASLAASMAASKGIIVVNSAGNSGNSAWHYITAPSDATNILCVGAADKNRHIAVFSSRGPASDGRVKPDVVSYGFQTVSASAADGETVGVNGTSLSSPVIAGLVACLWQEFPKSTAFEVMDAVRRSADLYANPNDSMGYGIPDFTLARQLLRNRTFGSDDYVAEIYPNPFSQGFTISFYMANAQEVEIGLFDALGRTIESRKIQAEAENLTKVSMGTYYDLPKGVYFVSIRTKDKLMVKKLIRG